MDDATMRLPSGWLLDKPGLNFQCLGSAWNKHALINEKYLTQRCLQNRFQRQEPLLQVAFHDLPQTTHHWNIMHQLMCVVQSNWCRFVQCHGLFEPPVAVNIYTPLHTSLHIGHFSDLIRFIGEQWKMWKNNMAVLSSENLERTELFAFASQKLKACCSTYKNRIQRLSIWIICTYTCTCCIYIYT